MAFGRAIVGVEGQYFFAFEIEGLGDFLGDGGHITEFVMEEKIGGDVPAFKLVFKTLDSTILKRLNEGAKVICTFGKSTIENKVAKMTVQKFSYKLDKADFLEITIMGLLKNGVEYLRHPEQASFKDKTSVDVIASVAQKYFNVWNETTRGSDDKMTWIRPNQSSAKFIDDVWKRSYVSDDNILVFGLEMDGWFRITDLKAIMKQPVKWGLQINSPGEYLEKSAMMAASSGYIISPGNIVPYNPNIEMTSDFGLLNNTVIHKKTSPIHNITEGANSQVQTPDLKPHFSSNLNIMKDAPNKFEFQITANALNVHKNYSKSRLVNFPNQALVNSVELNITLDQIWQNYFLFDLIYFNPWRPKPPALYATEIDTLGGLYMISRISRFFANNRAVIKITITRDGLNGMEGDLFSFF